MKQYRIGEVAELLQIPKSTLRYWDEKNLIQLNRNQENNYRVYTLQEMLNIVDVDLYRKLSIPVNKLTEMYQWDADTWDDILNRQLQEVEEKIQSLAQIKKELISRKDKLSQISQLKGQGFTAGQPDIQNAVSFDLIDKTMVSMYFQNPYDCVVVIPPEIKESAFDPIYGLSVSQIPKNSEIIWQQQPGKVYMQCLLQVSREEPLVSNYFKLITRLQQMGYQTGGAVGRFLATAKDDICYDYYKVWVEVF